jgi:hypothetical protein
MRFIAFFAVVLLACQSEKSNTKPTTPTKDAGRIGLSHNDSLSYNLIQDDVVSGLNMLESFDTDRLIELQQITENVSFLLAQASREPEKVDIDRSLILLKRANEALQSESSKTDTACQNAEKKLAAVLKKSEQRVPAILRKNYGKWANQEAWESDMKVQVNGSGNTNITFVHHSFAANANIKTAFEKLESRLRELGFKRANFKWFDLDDDYVYYTLN